MYFPVILTSASRLLVAVGALVKAGWDPGEGRIVRPLSHEEFKKAWIKWIRTGAYAPRP